MKTNAMNDAKFVKDDATGSVQSDGLSTIREDPSDGLAQSSKRRTYKRVENTYGTLNVHRSNKFDVLNLAERGLKVVEVNAVGVVQEIVEIDVDSAAAESEQRRRRRWGWRQ